MNANTAKMRILIRSLKDTLNSTELTMSDAQIAQDLETSRGEGCRFIKLNEHFNDETRHYQYHARFLADQIDIVHTITDYGDIDEPVKQQTHHINMLAGDMAALAIAWLEWWCSDEEGQES
jgi:hypothetical protein